MILRFSSTVEQVQGWSDRLRVFVRPIAGIELLEVDRTTLVTRADGVPASPSDLLPGARVVVTGEDDGSPCLRARALVLESLNHLHSSPRCPLPPLPIPSGR